MELTWLMRILHLSLSYVPSRRASSVQVMKMCAAMARLGHEVVLVAKQGPAAERVDGADDFASYGVDPCFRLEKLLRPDGRGGGAVYWAAMAGRLAARRRWADLVYCRDPMGGAMVAWTRLPFVFEAHGLPFTGLQRALWRRMASARRLVATIAVSAALDRDIRAEGLLPGRDCIIAPNGADAPVPVATRRLRGPGHRPRVGYVGSLYRGRGIELLLEVARKMPHCQFDLVGGTDRDVERWRATSPPPNVEFHGFHRHSRLDEFYARFDAVVMPHSLEGVVGASGSEDFSRWTSPLKMFEYMGSGVPLIASDLPVLQEVLRDGENALIARAGDVDDWVEKIAMAIGDPARGQRLAAAAAADLGRSYTWDARASHVLGALARLGTHSPRSPRGSDP